MNEPHQQPFRVALPDGTATGDLTDEQAAEHLFRHPGAILIVHGGGITEARRVQEVHWTVNDLHKAAADAAVNAAHEAADRTRADESA